MRIDFTPQEGLQAAWGHFMHHGRQLFRSAVLVVKYAILSALWSALWWLLYHPPTYDPQRTRQQPR